MANSNKLKWAQYHAFSSNEANSGGKLRYLMDRFDIHPRRSLLLTSANLKTLGSRRKIPVFIHIPKTGGTYIVNRLKGSHAITMNHMLLREQLIDKYIPVGLMGTKWKPTKRHVLFTTVRNPLHFFRSYYHHVAGHSNLVNRWHYDYKHAAKGFEYLMRTIMAREDTWPSRKFLYPQLFDQSGQLVVNWINKNESLDYDMKCLAEKLGDSPYIPGEKKRAAPVKDLDDYYSESLKDLVYEVYAREFEVFGYMESEHLGQKFLHHDVSLSKVSYKYVSDELIWQSA